MKHICNTMVWIIVLATLSNEAAGTHREDAYASAWCIFTEARGEGTEGKKAVLSVIINRSRNKDQTITETIFQRKQFSGVGKGVPDWFYEGPGPNWPAKHKGEPDCKAYRESLRLGFKAAAGKFEPIGPWTHYYAYKQVTPYWSDSLTCRERIGNHIFGTTN